MGPTKIGRGGWTSCGSPKAKCDPLGARAASGKCESSLATGSSGTYPFLCMRLGMTHGRPPRAFAPRQRRLDGRGQTGLGRRAKIESPGVMAENSLAWSAGSGSRRRRGHDVDGPWAAPEAPRTPEGPRAPPTGTKRSAHRRRHPRDTWGRQDQLRARSGATIVGWRFVGW